MVEIVYHQHRSDFIIAKDISHLSMYIREMGCLFLLSRNVTEMNGDHQWRLNEEQRDRGWYGLNTELGDDVFLTHSE